MSDYGTMIARIADEMPDPGIVNRIPKSILSAIRHYESERFWFNEGESTSSTVADQQAYGMPSDYLQGDLLTVTDTVSAVRRRLRRRSWEWLRGHLQSTQSKARPDDWAYYADQLWLYPIPDQAYTLTLSYLRRLDALSAYADTNDWMTHGEELIRCRAKWDLLLHAAKTKDAGLISAMKDAENEALDDLNQKSTQKVAAGKVSMDDALVSHRRHYNILYQ